jgi:hypothetical protein
MVSVELKELEFSFKNDRSNHFSVDSLGLGASGVSINTV